MEQCSFCQGNVDPATRLCRRCGKSQPVETALSPSGAEASDDTPTTRCQRCGTAVPASAHFCPKCGLSFTIQCQRCGTEVPASTHFCPKCRWPLMLNAPQSHPAQEAAPAGPPPDEPAGPRSAPFTPPPSVAPQTRSRPFTPPPDEPTGPRSAPFTPPPPAALPGPQSAPVRVRSVPLPQQVEHAPAALPAKSASVTHPRGAPRLSRTSLDTYLARAAVAPKERGRMSGKALSVIVVGVLLVAAVATAFVVLRGLAGNQPASTASSLGTVVLSFGDNTVTVNAAAWSPNGQEIALGENNNSSQEGAVQVIDATSGHVLLTHQGWSGGLAWMPDGNAIVSSRGDGTLSIWSASTGQPILTFGNYAPGASMSLALSHNGKLLAVANSSKAVDIWDVATGAQLTTYTSLSAAIHALAWSPDDSRLAAAGGNNNVVQIWDATRGATLLTYQGHATAGQIAAQSVSSLSWSPDGKEIASASQNGELRVWDASAGKTLWTYHGALFQSSVSIVSAPVAWSSNGARIAFADPFDGAQLFDATSGKVLYSHQSYESGLDISCLAWSPDGDRIVAGGQNIAGMPVQVWLTN